MENSKRSKKNAIVFTSPLKTFDQLSDKEKKLVSK